MSFQFPSLVAPPPDFEGSVVLSSMSGYPYRKTVETGPAYNRAHRQRSREQVGTWNPFPSRTWFDPLQEARREVRRVQAEFDRLFDSMARPEEDSPTPGWVPKADAVEEHTAYVVYVELPGVPREEVSLEVREGTIVVSGEKRPPELCGGARRHSTERVYGPFRKVFDIPKTADATRVSAEMRDGVLKVSIPKLEPEARSDVYVVPIAAGEKAAGADKDASAQPAPETSAPSDTK
eukprot:m51a1_g2484 hypothetical protein (235) ;mRNA; r:83071-83853